MIPAGLTGPELENEAFCEILVGMQESVESLPHQQTFLNQLREITGINDAQILQQALKDSNGNLELAVAFLTAKNAKTPQQEETAYYQTALPGNDRYISVGSQADTNVIDLTGDDKDDLQRAIALSLAESNRAFRETGITDEEQAISRVLEASIAENKACLKRTPTEVWRDSRNPYDRKRQDRAPVGLKNVGNTCWFSAVIQEHRNLPFMRELRYLFALLVGTKRKYVDPSRAVEILKDAFKSNDSQQQDVSEFTHKLLDWLEDAFQMKAEEETYKNYNIYVFNMIFRDEEKPKNPMVELFYGRFLAVGVLEGKKFENTEMFGQYPLQVNGFKDLHECLEAAMIEGEIESLHSENSGKSGQEVPYRLHAVLVHEGQANAGHYWAYIFDHRENRWMKYNDIAVTKSSWEELVRDSFGGYRNASAYCLMYINDKPQFLMQEEFNKETGQSLVGIETLPPDLRDFVEEDNLRFEKELEEWDAQVAQKALQEKLLATQKLRESESSVTTAQAGEPEYLEQPSRSDFSKHLKEETIRIITKASHEHEDKSPETVLQSKPENTTSQPPSNQQVVEVAIPHVGKFMIESKEGGYDDEAIKLEYSRLVKLAQEDTPPETDYRLHHVVVYFIQNQAPKKIIEKTLLEQFGDRNLSFDERCHNIMKVAQAKIEMIKPEEVNLEEYEKLNEQAAELFESGEDREVNNGLIIMNEFIVPFLPLLLVDEMEEKDILAVEDMRNRWCSYLGQEMESNLQEKLTDFLPKLLDCSTEIKGFHEPPKLPSYSTHELCERFARIMLSLSRTPADGR
ncbi:hypothetical protein CB1_000706032 [Camelus ferus]|nr:hypothetical protein CB1_000706032 [Camelus ferus]